VGAKDFSEIDDPTAFDLNENSWVTIARGEIGVLCTPEGCALLKIGKINKTENSFHFKFQIIPGIP